MTRRLLSIAGIVIAGSVLLTGCGALAGQQSGAEPAMPVIGGSSPDWAGEPDVAPQPGLEESGGDQGASGGGAPDQAADEERAVIVSGTLSMRVGDPIAAADAVADAAEARGGSVDRRAEGASTDFQPAWAMLTVRVPEAQVEDLLATLRQTGEVTSVDLGEEVVTDLVRDLEVRVDASRASVERLTELLTTAADTATLLEVEAQLTQRTSELEQLLSQQRTLADQVAMSTIEVRISSTSVAGPTGTPTFWDGLVDGWNAFLAWGATVLYGLGQSIPALVLLAILALVAWLVIRRLVRLMPSPVPSPASAPEPAVANPATPGRSPDSAG